MDAEQELQNAIDFRPWHEAVTLTISGPKVLDFLQGYLTNDLSQLALGVLSPTAVCNLKGRVVANGWVYLDTNSTAQADRAAAGNELEVARFVMHQTLGERMREFLAPYAQFSRCKLELEQTPVYVTSEGGRSSIAGKWCLIPHSSVLTHVQTGESEPTQPAQDASDAITRALIETNFAWISAPCTEKFLPQMLGLDLLGAIDFDKGCYLGQEVVARAHFRGAVKRTLEKNQWHDQPPIVGVKSDAFGIVVAFSTVGEEPLRGDVLGVS